MENTKHSIKYFDPIKTFNENIKTYKVLESEKSGKVWKIVVIESGWSDNGIYYGADLLDRDKSKFENAIINAYKLGYDFFDHAPDDVYDNEGKGFAKNVVGWISNVRSEKLDNDIQGLVADFYITNNFFIETFRNASEQGRDDLLGFSIDCICNMTKGISEGRGGYIVTNIKKVNSVDIVTNPAAGGKLLRMVASQMKKYNIEDEKNIKIKIKESEIKKIYGGKYMEQNEIKLLIDNVRKNPSMIGITEDLTQKTDDDIVGMILSYMAKQTESKETTEAKPITDVNNTNVVEKAKESEPVKEGCGVDLEKKKTKEAELMGMYDNDKLEKIIMMLKALLSKENEKIEVNDMETKKEIVNTESVNSESVKVKESVDSAKIELAIISDKLKKIECSGRLKESLMSSKLPEIVKDKISKQFEGKIFEEADLKNVIQIETDVMARLSESGMVKGVGESVIVTGDNKADRLQKAIDLLVDPRLKTDINVKESYKDIQPSGLKEIYVRMTGDKEVRGIKDLSRVTESTSSDFTAALGTSMNKRLVKRYSFENQRNGWDKFVEIKAISDFKRQDIIRIGGLGLLSTVAEDGTYTALTTPTEENPNYTAIKKGNTFYVTREMIKNDDLRFIQTVAEQMGRSASVTLAKYIYDLLTGAGASSGAINVGTIYDSAVLYSASRGNYTTSALSFTTLDAALTAMANQTELSSSFPIGIKGRYLIVPEELRSLAKILVDSETKPSTVSTSDLTNQEINPVYKAVEPIIVNKYFLGSDANNWFIVGDPMIAETIEMGFVDGRQEPEIFVQEGETLGTVFTNDRITYKVRHEYAGCVVDARSFYGGIVA